ncbi:ABC-2 transporter permease [Oceanobacillus kapialis]|uniref:ABC-2 transporter permease n=1 Tax=Oceanobacillus kapialis TaxID=481353 RepID=UPI00384DC4E0
MLSLLRYNFLLLTFGTWLSFFLAIPIFYAVMIPPIFLYIVFVTTIILSYFYTDQRAKSTMYVASLPVKLTSIVKSRYVSVSLISFCLLFYQWGWGVLINNLFGIGIYVYTWKDIFVLAGLTILIVSLVTPIYYAVKSFLLATGIVLIGYFLAVFYSLEPLTDVLGMEHYIIFNDLDAGFVLLVEKYVPFQPFIMLGIVVMVLLFLSLKLSERLFISRKRIN